MFCSTPAGGVTETLNLTSLCVENLIINSSVKLQKMLCQSVSVAKGISSGLCTSVSTAMFAKEITQKEINSYYIDLIQQLCSPVLLRNGMPLQIISSINEAERREFRTFRKYCRIHPY